MKEGVKGHSPFTSAYDIRLDKLPNHTNYNPKWYCAPDCYTVVAYTPSMQDH